MYGLGVGAYLVGCYDSRKERDGYPGQFLRPGAGRWRLTCTAWAARISHPGRKMGLVAGIDRTRTLGTLGEATSNRQTCIHPHE